LWSAFWNPTDLGDEKGSKKHFFLCSSHSTA
jgi:hypothetical protein